MLVSVKISSAQSGPSPGIWGPGAKYKLGPKIIKKIVGLILLIDWAGACILYLFLHILEQLSLLQKQFVGIFFSKGGQNITRS